ncbi:uncharacterized protein G2W53_027236 [Senna tora]|uniref:Uncharacterized protein n=1 Tax=Senna tora TaxID=362788 RepID=A0A834WJM3_9FABA|nr:uncharacterized protein G2W53_027236 [Senna tora]
MVRHGRSADTDTSSNDNWSDGHDQGDGNSCVGAS